MKEERQEHLENLVMDELHEGARSCSELVQATGLSKFVVRRISRDLDRQGLVSAKVHGKTLIVELERTRRAA